MDKCLHLACWQWWKLSAFTYHSYFSSRRTCLMFFLCHHECPAVDFSTKARIVKAPSNKSHSHLPLISSKPTSQRYLPPFAVSLSLSRTITNIFLRCLVPGLLLKEYRSLVQLLQRRHPLLRRQSLHSRHASSPILTHNREGQTKNEPQLEISSKALCLSTLDPHSKFSKYTRKCCVMPHHSSRQHSIEIQIFPSPRLEV